MTDRKECTRCKESKSHAEFIKTFGQRHPMCDDCRKPYLKKNQSKKKKTKIPKVVKIVDTKVTYEKKDLEEIKTLKDYLEMKL